MNIWDNLAFFVPAKTRTAPVQQAQAQPIEVDGVFLGTVTNHELGVRFAAVNARVTEMDQSIGPNAGYAIQSARQLFRAGRPNRPA